MREDNSIQQFKSKVNYSIIQLIISMALHLLIIALIINFLVGFNILTLSDKKFDKVHWFIVIFAFVISLLIYYVLIIVNAIKGRMLYDRKDKMEITMKKYVFISLIAGFVIALGLWLPRFIIYLPKNEYGAIAIVLYTLLLFIALLIIFSLIIIPFCIVYKILKRGENR